MQTPYPERLGQRRGIPSASEIFTETGWVREKEWWGLVWAEEDAHNTTYYAVSTKNDMESNVWKEVWRERMVVSGKPARVYSLVDKQVIMGYVPNN